jgi:hypothetical protein
MEKKLYHFELRLNRAENKMLHKNAKAAGMYCSEYLRNLIKGFVPKTVPKADFYEVLQKLNQIVDMLPESQKITKELRTRIAELQDEFVNMDSVCSIAFDTNH